MAEAANNSTSPTSNVGETASPSNVAPPSDARPPSSPSLGSSPSRSSSPSAMIVSIRYPSSSARRDAILRAVESIFDHGGILRFLSSTLMYQEPSSVHIFSTEDLGFLVEHRSVWLPVFQNRKKHPDTPRCNYAAFSVILWNILQESKRFLEEHVGVAPLPDLLSHPPSGGGASPTSFLVDTSGCEGGAGPQVDQATPPPPPLTTTTTTTTTTTAEWLASWCSSCSWFAREERWGEASEREAFFHCLRRTTYAATLLATLVSVAASVEVRNSLRVGSEDVRLAIHLLEQLNQLYLDLSGFLEGNTNTPSTMKVSGTSPTTPSLPPLTVFSGPFAHHPPSRAYDRLTHCAFLAVEESVLQVQFLLVELPRNGATLLDEADVIPIIQAFYRTELWEASGVSLRSTQGYLAALKALLFSTTTSPSLSQTQDVAESLGKMIHQRVLHRPPYRHHSFRYSFLREHRAHEQRPQTTTTTTTTDPPPPSAPTPVPLSPPPQASDAGLYYPGGRCGGVLEPSFGLLQLFWAVKEGMESILCPSASTPVLAMTPLPSHAAATLAWTSLPENDLPSSPYYRVPRVMVQDGEWRGLQNVYTAAGREFDHEVEVHRRDGTRLSFYQLLGYALFHGMPTVDLVPLPALWERAWHTPPLAASSLPWPSPPSTTTSTTTTAAAHAMLQSYYTPVLRLLLATCYTVKRRHSATAAWGKGKRGWWSFLSAAPSAGREEEEEEEEEENERKGWHAWVSPESMLAVWDALAKCIFQEGVARYDVHLPIPLLPALPPLPTSHDAGGATATATTTGSPPSATLAAPLPDVLPPLPSSLGCCHLYSPFSLRDAPHVFRVCRWILWHPLFHALSSHALSASFASVVPTDRNEGGAHALVSSPSSNTKDDPRDDEHPGGTTTSSSSTTTTTTMMMRQTRDEEERVGRAFAVAKAMQERLQFIVQVWYHAGEDIQQVVWRETACWTSRGAASSRRPWEGGGGGLLSTSLLSRPTAPPAPTRSSPETTTTTTTTTASAAIPSSPVGDVALSLSRTAAGVRWRANAPPNDLSRVAIPRFCAWIEMLTSVLHAFFTIAIRRAVFPCVLLPSILDSATRVFALYTVYIVKGQASFGVLYARGGGGGGMRKGEPVCFPSLPSPRAMASQVASLSSLLMSIPARLPSAAVNALLEKQLVPLAQQVAEDGELYGIEKDGKWHRENENEKKVHRLTKESEAEEAQRCRSMDGKMATPPHRPPLAVGSPSPTEGQTSGLPSPFLLPFPSSSSSSSSTPKDALFYARFEGYLLALGTPGSAFAVSDTLFLTYWADIAITGCGTIPTPRIPLAMPFLASLWKAGLDFLCAAFYSKRPLCPLLLPSLVRLMMPSTRPTDSSSSSSSLFAFHYPEPPLSLLTEFCRQIRGVCESVVRCDGVQLACILKNSNSIPYALAKMAYAWHVAVGAEKGSQQIRMGVPYAWASPFFFPSASLCASTATTAVVEEGAGAGTAAASPPLSSTAPLVHIETTANATPEEAGAAGSSAMVPSPVWEEVLCKVTPCSVVLLVVSSLFDQLCVLAKDVLKRDGGTSRMTQFSLFFSALCVLLMIPHTEVLPRVCASLEALLTEHLNAHPGIIARALPFIESVVAHTTGPLKASLVQWYLHLVHQLGGVKSSSKL